MLCFVGVIQLEFTTIYTRYNYTITIQVVFYENYRKSSSLSEAIVHARQEEEARRDEQIRVERAQDVQEAGHILHQNARAGQMGENIELISSNTGDSGLGRLTQDNRVDQFEEEIPAQVEENNLTSLSITITAIIVFLFLISVVIIRLFMRE